MRYLPHTDADRQKMLQAIGAKNINDLFADVPANALLNEDVNLPGHQGELEVETALKKLAARNTAAGNVPFFLGAGAYRHHVPATVDYIIQRSEFLTSYTPYQPEIAQGTLMYLYEFQTYVANLTGMDVANASMYDGATSLTEAVLMAQRLTRKHNVTIAEGLHPHYTETLDTYLQNTPAEKRIASLPQEGDAAFVIQTPDFYGTPHSLGDIRKACDDVGAKLIVVFTEVLSLGLLPAPTEADIVVGDGQSIGVGLNYGGPHLGLFACKKEYTRQMPGRLCGKTTDADGKVGYVLTLNTREQHIRREKATSNICTNVGLCALAFTVHMSLLGEEGFKTLARRNHEKACELADALENINGIKVVNKAFFNEFTVQLPTSDAFAVVETLAAQNIIAGHPLPGGRLLVAVTETTTDADIQSLCNGLKEVLS